MIGLRSYASLTLSISVLLVACADEPPPPEDSTPRVKYFVVGEQTAGQLRRLSGKLVAADTSPLSFNVSGSVQEVLIAQGDGVQQGDLLARLDPEPLRIAVTQARAKLNVARANVVETKQIYERTAGLFEKRASSKAELDTATANHAAARGNLRAAESDLEKKERDLTRAELTAPFTGTIASRSIEPFQEVTAGEEAFILQTDDVLEVEVRVPETLIRYVDYGQVVQVALPSVENQTLNGVVTEVGSRAESGNAFPVSVRLVATELDLRPGMTAGVTFNFDEYLEGRTVYLIPLSAVAIDYGVVRRAQEDVEDTGESTPIYIVNDQNQLEVRDVVVGGLRGNQLEVFEGLEAGDKVVSAGVSFLREGMTVELWSSNQGLTGG